MELLDVLLVLYYCESWQCSHEELAHYLRLKLVEVRCRCLLLWGEDSLGGKEVLMCGMTAILHK